MKKVAKMFVVITVALIVTAGAASAEWMHCTATEVIVRSDTNIRFKVVGACPAKAGNAWVSVVGTRAKPALSVVLTAISLNKYVTFRKTDSFEGNKGVYPLASTVGLK